MDTELDSRVLYEDNHLIIVNKLSGEPVQGDPSGDKPLLETVRDYLRVKGNKQGNVFCGLVHRIDRPVSGAVIFAKTSKALARMNELIKQREISKVYWAIVEGKPKQDAAHLTHFLRKNEKQNKSITSEVEQDGWQRAELEYRILASSDRYSLLEVKLLTGRHHQIRAQLSAVSCPIKGDLKYGAKRSNEQGSICLHARHIEFEHPVSHQIVSVFADPMNPLFFSILNG